VPMAEGGHRTVPHTADLIIEAWAPTREACLGEAVHALVETFADTSEVSTTRQLSIQFPCAADEELLVAVLEEVIYLLEVFEVVPVDVSIIAADDGGLGGCFDVAVLATVRIVGSAPKAVARSELVFGSRNGSWKCRVLVDV
jgi:SHS2 domain-containing protein